MNSTIKAEAASWDDDRVTKEFPAARKLVEEAVAAGNATPEQTADARRKSMLLATAHADDAAEYLGEPIGRVIRSWAYNGYLLCIREGKPLKDTAIIDAAKRLHRANEIYFACAEHRRKARERRREQESTETRKDDTT